ASLPKLTAAAPVSQPREDEGTQVVDNSEVLASVEAAQPRVQPIVPSAPRTDPEGAPISAREPEPAEDAPISPVDETIVRHRPGVPTPVPAQRAAAAPPPLPPRPKASVPPVDETSPPAPAPPESIGGVPVLASIGAVTLAHPESPEAPEGALAVSAPSLAPAPADVSPQDAPGSPSEPVTEAAPVLPRPPPVGSPNDFPFLSPALASAGSSTAELEAVDRAA